MQGYVCYPFENRFVIYSDRVDNRVNRKKEDAKHVAIHEKKLQNLTQNSVLPLTADEVIKNWSNYTLTDQEKSLLKNGLQVSLPPAKLLCSDVVTAFEMMNTYLPDK